MATQFVTKTVVLGRLLISYFPKNKKQPCNNDFFFRIALKQIRTHLDSCATSCYIDIFEYPLWFCPPEVSYEIWILQNCTFEAFEAGGLSVVILSK